MTNSPKLGLEYMVSGESAPWVTFNEAVNRLESYLSIVIIDRDLATPPGSPAEGDTYIIAASATDEWAGYEGQIASYFSGWQFLEPFEDLVVRVTDERCTLSYISGAWVPYVPVSVHTGLTASTTQTQGQVPLTKTVNRVTTCANTNDAVTLPAAAQGRACTVINRGAQTLQVFPASGDAIDTGAADASTTIAAAAKKSWVAMDGTTWESV